MRDVLPRVEAFTQRQRSVKPDMLITCSYSVWHGLRDWLSTDLQPLPASSYRHLKTWWHKMLSSDIQGRNAVKERTTKFFYGAWNI
jgi:hypothetical protein